MDICNESREYRLCERGLLSPLTDGAVAEIQEWAYDAPYDVYSFTGYPNDYLLDRATWGTEQFCLMADGQILGQAACQYEGTVLWVGWSMAPELCGQGMGAVFVKRCVQELCRVKGHTGRILLRVAAWNKRAIHAYQRAGFTYLETIQDEIAYSGRMEDHWVMEHLPLRPANSTASDLA